MSTKSLTILGDSVMASLSAVRLAKHLPKSDITLLLPRSTQSRSVRVWLPKTMAAYIKSIADTSRFQDADLLTNPGFLAALNGPHAAQVESKLLEAFYAEQVKGLSNVTVIDDSEVLCIDGQTQRLLLTQGEKKREVFFDELLDFTADKSTQLKQLTAQVQESNQTVSIQSRYAIRGIINAQVSETAQAKYDPSSKQPHLTFNADDLKTLRELGWDKPQNPTVHIFPANKQRYRIVSDMPARLYNLFYTDRKQFDEKGKAWTDFILKKAFSYSPKDITLVKPDDLIEQAERKRLQHPIVVYPTLANMFEPAAQKLGQGGTWVPLHPPTLRLLSNQTQDTENEFESISNFMKSLKDDTGVFDRKTYIDDEKNRQIKTYERMTALINLRHRRILSERIILWYLQRLMKMLENAGLRNEGQVLTTLLPQPTQSIGAYSDHLMAALTVLLHDIPPELQAEVSEIYIEVDELLFEVSLMSELELDEALALEDLLLTIRMSTHFRSLLSPQEDILKRLIQQTYDRASMKDQIKQILTAEQQKRLGFEVRPKIHEALMNIVNHREQIGSITKAELHDYLKETLRSMEDDIILLEQANLVIGYYLPDDFPYREEISLSIRDIKEQAREHFDLLEIEKPKSVPSSRG